MAGGSFDLIVIGAGPGGYVCAIRAAQLGLKVACIESRATLGGTCLNVGCIPSKAVLESSELYAHVSHQGKEHGLQVGSLAFDVAAMMKRKTQVVDGLTKGIEGLFKKNKITWLKGKGSFAGPGRVSVTDSSGVTETHEAKHIVIATGSEPIELKIAPFDGESIVDSTGALEFKSVPKHLILIGGGVVGLELGSVWLRLGAKVTVVEAQERIIATMDNGVSAALQKSLSKQGMNILLKTKLLKAEKKGKDVVVSVEREGKTEELTCDRVLVAVGRRAYTKDLSLSSVGIIAEPNGKIAIDSHFKTGAINVYAIGDVVAGPMLAHKAEEEGVAIAELIAGKAGHVNYETIPGVVYTSPEVASVGATEEELKAKGIVYKVGQFPFLANGRAKALGDTEGFVKILADATTDRVLGVHIVGPRASELIGECAVAMEFSASAEDIARSVHAHPTLAEVIKEAALGVDKRSLHI